MLDLFDKSSKNVSSNIKIPGKNPVEKTSDDLLKKYELVASLDDLRTQCGDKLSFEHILEKIKDFQTFYSLWKDIYRKSNKFTHEIGMAARKSKIAIVSGAVLNCLPALESSLVSRKASEKTLRVVRIEESNTNERYVGMKYPCDDAAIINLRAILTALRSAKSETAGKKVFIEESLPSVDERSLKWLSSAPKTMKSFFKSASSSGTTKKRAVQKSATENIQKKKKTETKTKSISSFFSAPSWK